MIRRLIAFTPRGTADLLFRWLNQAAGAVRCISITTYTLFFRAEQDTTTIQKPKGARFNRQRAASTRNVISATFMRCREQAEQQRRGKP